MNNEEWKQVDFHALRKQAVARIDDQITSLRQDQTHFRDTHTSKQIESSEAL